MHPNTYYLAVNRRGIWEIRWTERDTERGQSRSQRASTGQTERSAAEAYQAQWLRARAEAITTLAKPTVGECIDAYLADCGERGVHDSQRKVLAAVRRALGALRPGDLRGEPLQGYRRSRGLTVSASTVARELSALTAALNWAGHEDKGAMIEARDVPRILKPRIVRAERRWLNEDEEVEFHRLALGWPRTRVGMYVALGLNTGARKEAIEELSWDRVDLRAGLVDFRVPGERLTNKRRVPAPINDRLRAVLEGVPERLRWGRVVGNGNVRGGYDAFRRATPYPWVSSHIMRHTFVTLGLRAGIGIWEIAQMVGDNPDIISRHYGHHLADWKLKEAANKRFAGQAQGIVA